MYSTKMEPYAWTLGIQATISAQASLLKFSLMLALWQWAPTRMCHPTPVPTTSPKGLLVHLCFVTPLRVLLVVITAPSVMRVPFGIVTRLSCLAWVVMFERWPC